MNASCILRLDRSTCAVVSKVQQVVVNPRVHVPILAEFSAANPALFHVPIHECVTQGFIGYRSLRSEVIGSVTRCFLTPLVFVNVPTVMSVQAGIRVPDRSQESKKCCRCFFRGHASHESRQSIVKKGINRNGCPEVRRLPV